MSEFQRPGINPGINPIQHDPCGFSNRRSIFACFEGEFNGGLSGERGLVVAILWRAYADLKLPSHNPDHRSAKSFFLSLSRSHKHRFTFLYCCECLALCPVKFLRFLTRNKLLTRD